MTVGTVKKEIESLEAYGTPTRIAKLKNDYDADLRKEHPSIQTKFQYGKLLCFSSSRGSTRRGIELLEEIRNLLSHESEMKERSRSIAAAINDEEYVFVEHETKEGDDDDSEEKPSLEHQLAQAQQLMEKCLYFVAIANYRLGEYKKSISLCEELLGTSSKGNDQDRAEALKDLSNHALMSRNAIGVLCAIGVALPAFFWHKGGGNLGLPL